MGWKTWGDPFETGELANTNKFVSMKFVNNKILIAIRTWVIFYNDPTFTNLCLKIYSNSVIGGENTPNALLATSTNTLTKAEIITLENGVKEIYFEFNFEPINGEDTYNFVLNGDGYVYSANSHIAWQKAWPDPVYTAGFTPTGANLSRAPYQIYGIGGDF